jgi:hypothetical protein
MIKYRSMRRGNLKEEVHLEGLGVNWRIILKHMLKKWDGMGVDRTWIRTGTSGGLFRKR